MKIGEHGRYRMPFVVCCLSACLIVGLASCGDSGTPVDVIDDGVSDVGGDAIVDGNGPAGDAFVGQDVSAQIDSEMVKVPTGILFQMGCSKADESICEPDELPYHPVNLPEYYMDKTEVTQGMYKVCVDAGQCDEPPCEWDPVAYAEKPVVCVSWQQAGAFCEWAGRRLPTEAEWEKAARGTNERRYPWGNNAPDCVKAVMNDGTGEGCGTGDTFSVCSRQTPENSPYKMCDVAGNVWEWTADWYAADYYTSSPGENPQGPDTGTVRVMRGGSYTDVAAAMRTSDRAGLNPAQYDKSVGFRCAKSM